MELPAPVQTMEWLPRGREPYWSMRCQRITPPSLASPSCYPPENTGCWSQLCPLLPLPIPGWASFNGISTFHKIYSPILTPKEQSSQMLEDISNWKEESRFFFPMWKQERKENVTVDSEDSSQQALDAT